MTLSPELSSCLISFGEQKDAKRQAKKDQKVINDINAQTEVVKYPTEMWKRLTEFAVKNRLVTPADVTALGIACKLPNKIPNSYQSKCLLKLLDRAQEEGFSIN